ncbi:MAG: hypothetical protein IPJ74_09420 [Saprospiraceae bacterium]|nr:hypothetical protein [Saprospiraceae bacterium]
MTVKAVLWKFFTLKNGTSNVKIYAYQNSRYVYLKTDIHVAPEQWDEERGEVKKTHPQYKMINAAIQRKIVEISNHFYSGGDLNGLLRKKSPQSGSLLVFAQNFINEIEKGLHEIKPSTNKKHKGALSRLRMYCRNNDLEDFAFEDVTLEFYYRYSEF